MSEVELRWTQGHPTTSWAKILLRLITFPLSIRASPIWWKALMGPLSPLAHLTTLLIVAHLTTLLTMATLQGHWEVLQFELISSLVSPLSSVFLGWSPMTCASSGDQAQCTLHQDSAPIYVSQGQASDPNPLVMHLLTGGLKGRCCLFCHPFIYFGYSGEKSRQH